MKLLLDESLPRGLRSHFTDHEVATVPARGWSVLSNGELLDLARGEFDVFLTADQNLQYQQSLENRGISVVVLAARTNRLQDLLPLVPRVLAALEGIRPGQVVRVAA